jgi:hypothetical protein
MTWNAILFLVGELFLPSDGSSWQWPLRPPVSVVRPFDPPAHPWEAGHRGVDLAARPGQAVYAAGPGRVGFARDLAGRGVVTVIHGRLRTTYLPVRPSVRAGQVVAAGARIGVVEDVLGHCGSSSCLHWGLREGSTYFDPLTLLGRGPVRLLPWWDVVRPPKALPHGDETPDKPSGGPGRGRAPAQRPGGATGPWARSGAGAAPPSGRTKRRPSPNGRALADTSIGDALPATSFALVASVFATAALRPGRRHRAGSRQGYPQIATGLPRSVTLRQIRGRR